MATHPAGDYFIISHLSSLLGLQDHPNFTDIETETQKVVSTPRKQSPDSMLQCLYTMTYTKACDDLTPASQNSPENTWGVLAPVQGSSETVLKVPSTTASYAGNRPCLLPARRTWEYSEDLQTESTAKAEKSTDHTPLRMGEGVHG